MTITSPEFVRRFLLRVLPPGFVKIRYFGFLSNRRRARMYRHPACCCSKPPPQVRHDLLRTTCALSAGPGRFVS
jgi:hypothetical protein